MTHREPRIGFSDLPLFDWRCSAATRQNDPDTYVRAVGVPDYDVCSARSGDQGGSAAANALAAPTKQQQRDAVLAAVVRRSGPGGTGLTLRELARMWGVPMHTISGRFSELRDLKLIARMLDQDGKPILRDGCGIWIDAALARRTCPF